MCHIFLPDHSFLFNCWLLQIYPLLEYPEVQQIPHLAKNYPKLHTFYTCLSPANIPTTLPLSISNLQHLIKPLLPENSVAFPKCPQSLRNLCPLFPIFSDTNLLFLHTSICSWIWYWKHYRESYCESSGLQFPVQHPPFLLHNLSHPLSLVPTWILSHQHFLEIWFTKLLRAERTNTTQRCLLQVITERIRNNSGKQTCLLLFLKGHQETFKLYVLFHYEENPNSLTLVTTQQQICRLFLAHFVKWLCSTGPEIAEQDCFQYSINFSALITLWFVIKLQ